MKNLWIEKNNGLEKEFHFKDFKEAFIFMKQVAEIAEELNHHPEWSNKYNKVYLRLYTFDKQNTLSEKDKLFAARIDALTKNT